MLKISPSKIQNAECPFKFYQDYLSGLQDVIRSEGPETPVNLLVGRFVHQVLDFYTKKLLALKMKADEELLAQIFDKAWQFNEYIPNSLHDELKDFMMEFGATYTVDLQYTWASEKEIALSWDMRTVEWKSDDAWLRCKLDRIDIFPEEKTAVITDYKTARYIPIISKLRKSLQTLIYPFVMHRLNPYLTRIEMVFHFVRWNKKVTIVFVLESPTGDEILLEPDKIEKQLKEFTERMMAKIEQSTEWPAIRGESCGICQHECPLVALGLEPIRTLERATEVAMQLEALSSKRKTLRAMLQDFVKGTDSKVQVHNGYYAYGLVSSLRGMKASAIAQYCLEKGINLDAVLSFDPKKLSKIDDEEIVSGIRSLGKMSRPSTEFMFYREAIEDNGDDIE